MCCSIHEGDATCANSRSNRVEREKSGVRGTADQVTDNCYNCGKQANHTKQLYSKPGKSFIDGPVAALKLATNFIRNVRLEGDLCGRICAVVLLLTSLSSAVRLAMATVVSTAWMCNTGL